MKALLLSLLTPLLLGLIPKTSPSALNLPSAITEIEGGTIIYEFDDQDELSHFSLYSELDHNQYVMDGSLYNWVMCEQKTILTGYELSEYVLDTVVSTINPSGKIDGGFYFGGKAFSNPMDGATAYNLNVEHSAEQNTFTLKIHEFSNGKWLGDVLSVTGIPFYNNEVHLRLSVDHGEVSAFVNDESTPRITMSLDEEETTGLVGFRAFYAPQYFRYFSITAPEFSKNYDAFNAVYEKAKAIKAEDYTSKTYNALKEYLDELSSVDITQLNQISLDEITSKLQKLLDNLMPSSSFTKLQELIAEVEPVLEERDKYTSNSIASVEFCLTEAKKLTEDSPADEISYWYNVLSYRYQELIRLL